MVDGFVDESTTRPAEKVSFGVKRKEESKVKAAPKTVINIEIDSDEEREKEEVEAQAKRRKLTHFEDGYFAGDEDKKKENVVIPMVIENDWRTQKLLDKEKEGTLTEEEKAKLALLQVTTGTEDESVGASNRVIVATENRDDAPDADYGAIPIESFGLAILRGCNWKDGEGIGKNPQVVPLRLPARRPNGLGLGATPKTQQNDDKKTNSAKEEKDEEVKKGSCIKIVDGRNKGLYGKVEARDDDANSLFVRLAIGARSIKVSLFAVQTVSTKEYERDSKCLNKSEYDKEKERVEKQNMKNGKHNGSRGDEPSTSSSSKREDKGAKSRYSEKDDDKSKGGELWVRSDLVVRFIGADYKGGRLHKQKVRVVDVAGKRDVTIEDDRGNTHFNIRQSNLETVIPRDEGEKLMVVAGKRRGKVGIMLKKDKEKEMVTARLIHSDETVKLYFEDVCSFKSHHDDDYE